MPKRILALLLVTGALLTAGAPNITFAASLNDAVQQVQRETGGRVLSADTVNQGGRTVHRIKVLTPSGQVRIVTIDAQSRPLRRRSVRILVVEDEASLRAQLEAQLRKAGYAVDAAADGETASISGAKSL